MPTKMIIDTDTGSDDAVALLMAFQHPDIEVIGITTVSGNVPMKQGTLNALYCTELCNVDVPVYEGADRPLLRDAFHAEYFHGEDGLGDQGDAYVPTRQPADGHAVDQLIKLIQANPGVVLVTLGPLTNVALALRQAPEIVQNVSRCVVMGGAACTFGNVSPAAEFNVWCDPEAARIVFHSGMKVEMVGWELSIDNYALNFDEIEAIRQIDTPLAHFTIDCNETAIEAFRIQTGQRALALPDPVAMAVAIDPSICTHKSDHYVDVETQSDLTRGMTVVDRLDVSADPQNNATWTSARASGVKVTVCWEIDSTRWKNLLRDLLK